MWAGFSASAGLFSFYCFLRQRLLNWFLPPCRYYLNYAKYILRFPGGGTEYVLYHHGFCRITFKESTRTPRAPCSYDPRFLPHRIFRTKCAGSARCFLMKVRSKRLFDKTIFRASARNLFYNNRGLFPLLFQSAPRLTQRIYVVIILQNCYFCNRFPPFFEIFRQCGFAFSQSEFPPDTRTDSSYFRGENTLMQLVFPVSKLGIPYLLKQSSFSREGCLNLQGGPNNFGENGPRLNFCQDSAKFFRCALTFAEFCCMIRYNKSCDMRFWRSIHANISSDHPGAGSRPYGQPGQLPSGNMGCHY